MTNQASFKVQLDFDQLTGVKQEQVEEIAERTYRQGGETYFETRLTYSNDLDRDRLRGLLRDKLREIGIEIPEGQISVIRLP